MTTLVVSLTQINLIPIWLGGTIIARDIGLIIGTAYYRYTTLPDPKTLKRYFDFSLVTAEIQPPLISKLNTLFQLSLMFSTIFIPAIFTGLE
ncbi:hypothetical protein HK099_001647, partial [Clydaea vesicula]